MEEQYISLKGASHDPAGFSCGPGGLIPAELVPAFVSAIASGEVITLEQYLQLVEQEPDVKPMALPVFIRPLNMEGAD